MTVLSLYFFPFEFTFLPGINTKMAMAGIGLAVIAVQLARGSRKLPDKDFMTISALALAVSIIGFISITFNGTSDYTYATYIVSMLVWLSAANVAVTLIRQVNGRADVPLVCDYLIALCVAQCILALLVDNVPEIRHFVNATVAGQGFMGKNENRLYGIGCSLDVAGTRFCTILIMIVYRLTGTLERASASPDGRHIWSIVWYLAAFQFISVVGNMIARTTTIGIVLAIVYLLVITRPASAEMLRRYKRLWAALAAMTAAAAVICIVLYNSSPVFRTNIRFGFEGFFSLAEKGRWEVHSNDILKNMIVFPDNPRTWLLGNGYFENPYYYEPYYTGVQWHGYYQNTDIGYLRFIFYFGIFGLAAFMAYFIKVAMTCMKRFPEGKTLFLMILLVNFAVWLKVSTDIFLVFALFLCVPWRHDIQTPPYDTRLSHSPDI